MAAPKGHPNYNPTHKGCKEGALYGYLAKDENAWTDEELMELGVGLIKWFFESRSNIWMQEYFTEEKGILSETVVYLEKKHPKTIGRFLKRGREIQESRLASMPLTKKIDGNQARFILENKHGWQGKRSQDNVTEEEKTALSKLLNATRQIQESSNSLNNANITDNTAEKSE